MLNKLNISPPKKTLIVYIVLAIVTLAVYWQVNQYDFIIEDDVYVIANSQIKSGITLDEIRWAFRTTHAEFWHPLTWISLVFDYQLYGLNAGGYHVTNLILHILSSLMLFWLFNRMTGKIWESAFVAAFFALHPLHVESVAWVSERKDVLSGFFWMLTLCLYVYYTEKQMISRYLLVLFSFVLALMSKPMVITLPVIMVLLDYWPLSRCRTGIESHKSNLILWQLREKGLFFILSIIVSIITLYAQQYNPSGAHVTLASQFADSSLAFITYLKKIFWPHDLAFCHPSRIQFLTRDVLWAFLLIITITAAVIATVKRLPNLFVGWLWYAITLLPVIGIVRSDFVPFMFDHFTYLPSVGISIMLAWGIPLLFTHKDIRKKFLFPVAVLILSILTVLTWKQCGYWKNSISLFNHTLQITKDNALAYHHLGFVYDELGQYQLAINNYNEAIRIKPHHAKYYNNRGEAYAKLGQYQRAIDDYNQAICLQPHVAYVYHNRGAAYLLQGNNLLGCSDAQKACEWGNCKLMEIAKRKGYCR